VPGRIFGISGRRRFNAKIIRIKIVKLAKQKNITRWRRKNRVRKKLRGSAVQPRLSVHRSNKHLYCQLIDDESGQTLAAASTRDKSLRDSLPESGNCDAAKRIGQAIAERGRAAGVTRVVFDRGRFKFHGRVAELANAAREGGLQF
jgi:large subunit ribosomal protein L18